MCMDRRSVLSGVVTLSGVLVAGCSSLDSDDTTSTEDPEATERLAHSVSVYLRDGSETHTVSVTVQNASGAAVFEKDYRLSDSNEADENAPFPAASDPKTIIVTVDGTQFDRDWPGFEHPELPCNEATRPGIEIWVENDQDGTPGIRLAVNCQTIRMDG